MSRGLSATNLAQVNASHLHEVTLVKLGFDTPVYVHSGVGTIVYDSNSYLGVGGFGGVSDARESDVLGPHPITLTLSGIDTNLVAEALTTGNFMDTVTIYVGYRQDDGTLVDDPWIAWRGHYESASLETGERSSVSITCQHDLAVLGEKSGDRYNDEDQQSKYSGDLGLEYITEMANIKLNIGGQVISGQSRLTPERRGPARATLS